MERYLGLDVHAASCTFAVRDAAGKRIRRDVVETNGRALIGYLKQQPGRLHLCLEESEWAHWLWEILSPHVAEMVVVHGERTRGSKSDAIDADGLAERIQTGRVNRPVFKAPRRYAKLRELARVYRAVLGDVTRTKNRLKSCYRRRGVACPSTAIYDPKTRGVRIGALPPAMRPAVELFGGELDALEQLKTQARAALVKESHRYRISRILETAPGLGEIRVAQLLPIVVTPHRFRTKRQFWSYSGFGIVTRTSADWIHLGDRWARSHVAQTRGLNLNHNHVMKAIFKGAAITVIDRRAKPTRFRETYERLCDQGTKPNLAKLTVARQIAATVLAMWKSEEVYDPTR